MLTDCPATDFVHELTKQRVSDSMEKLKGELPLGLPINFGVPTITEGLKQIFSTHQNFAPSREPKWRYAVRRSGVQILPWFLIFVDVTKRLMDLHPSKPAEPLGPFGDMTLNSGGFFLPGCFRITVERNIS